MKKGIQLFILLAVAFLFVQNNATAQFTGQIHFEISNPTSSSGDVRGLSIAFSEERIFLNSNISMNLIAGLRAQGVLVRNDMSDFVVITPDDEGLRIEKNELDNLVMFVNRMQGKDPNARPEPFPWEEKIQETGRTQVIQGYEAIEFVLDGEENEKISVWLTDQIKVKWGLLMEAWYTVGASQFENEVPVEMVMNNNSFPLLVEVIRNEHVIYRAEAVNIHTPLRNHSITQLPAHIKLIGFTDLMMSFFRQQ